MIPIGNQLLKPTKGSDSMGPERYGRTEKYIENGERKISNPFLLLQSSYRPTKVAQASKVVFRLFREKKLSREII